MTANATNSKTKVLVYGALCIALSFALSYVKLFSMPFGGSVTLCSMLPLMFYAYRFGTPAGLLAGLAYGVLQFLQEPIVYHWAQVLLDYPLAFTMLGLTGITRSKADLNQGAAWRLPLGMLIACVGRLVFHVISAILFFAEYAPEGMSPWLYAFLYNGGFLGADLLICLLVVSIPPVRKTLLRL
ncbi:MAG: energy-coupled thiamine transporter ThiT [Clostridia bacterium]